MGLQTVPAYIGQTGYLHPVELDRNWIEAVAGRRTGAMRYGDFATTLVGSNSFQMAVSSGGAVILGEEAGQTQQGAYFVWSNASENLLFAGPSGSPRIDSLVLRVVDTQYGSDPGSPRAEWEIVQGTPAGSPVAKPDSDFAAGGGHYKPGAWWRIKNVRINPGDTDLIGGQVTDLMTWVRTGGRVLCRSKASFPTDNQPGDKAYDLSTGIEWTWGISGAWSGWVPPTGQLVASLEQNATQNLPNATSTAITWQVEFLDILEGHSLVTNISRYTPTIPGWFILSGGGSSLNNANGNRVCSWAKNGSIELASAVGIAATVGISTVMVTRTHPVWLNGTGDYVEMILSQDSGGTITTNFSTTQRSGMRVVYGGLNQ